jgi:hypothetical protein
MCALTPRLIDLFAKKLPALHRLNLYIGDWRDDNNGDAEESSSPVRALSRNSSLYTNLQIFLKEELRGALQQRTYSDWKLYDIGIWQSGSEVDGDLMQLLAKCIPTLRSFSMCRRRVHHHCILYWQNRLNSFTYPYHVCIFHVILRCRLAVERL